MVKVGGKKIFVGSLIILIVGIGIIAVGTGYLIFQTNKLKRAFADYMVARQGDVAVVSYTFDETGEYMDDGTALFHNADQPFVLASTMKLVVLAAYAEAVATGDLSPREEVSVGDWEQYYVPMTDGGAHVLGLKSMDLDVDEFGFAHNQGATVSLDDLARIMIHDSGNAATDYLILRIGEEDLEAVLSLAGVIHHTPVLPTMGPVLAMFNHENPQPGTAQLQSVIDDISGRDTGHLDHMIDRYLSDQAWREVQIEHLASYRALETLGEHDMWAHQAIASQLFPKGTAREYARLMAKIASGNFVSPAASEIMQQYLEGVPSDWPLQLLFYDRFGAKDGVTPGVLTIASYAVPKRGQLAGQNRVVVVLVNHMPFEQWSSQVQFLGHYLIQTDLAQATGVFTEVRNLE